MLLGVEPQVRLSDVYSGRVRIENAVFQFSPTLFLLADNPGGLAYYATPNIEEIFEPIMKSNKFDYILIDIHG